MQRARLLAVVSFVWTRRIDTTLRPPVAPASQATIAKMGAADYRLDKVDRNSPVLRIEYAKAKNGDRGGGGRGRDRGGGEDRDRGDRDRY